MSPIARLFRESGEQRDCSFVKAGTGVRIERRGTKAGHLYDLPRPQPQGRSRRRALSDYVKRRRGSIHRFPARRQSSSSYYADRKGAVSTRGTAAISLNQATRCSLMLPRAMAPKNSSRRP